MSEPRLLRALRTLRARIALWIVLSTALGLVIFGAAAYAVILMTEPAAGSITEEARTQVLDALALATPIGFALSITGAVWLSRRALAPVDRMLHAATEIGVDRIHQRLPVPEQPGELRELVLGLNHLLDRLESGYVALSSFAADVSHELRTPLAVIRNELEVALRRQRTVPEWEASARAVLDEIGRLGRLVDALLRLARIDNAAPWGMVDVEALVEQVVAVHTAAARPAELIIELESRQEPGPALLVRGDPDALAAALGNVLANAVRYTPAGGHIEVALEKRDRRLAIVVEDSGPGLSPDEVESIFVPFARGRAGRVRDGHADVPAGLGLGLPIARRIVVRHGGRLSAEPRATGGARFLLELPLAPPNDRDDDDWNRTAR